MSTQLFLPMFDDPPHSCRSPLAEHLARPRQLYATCIVRQRANDAADEVRAPKRLLLSAWLERIYGPTLGRLC